MSEKEQLELMSEALLKLMQTWERKIKSKNTSSSTKMYYRKFLNELSLVLDDVINKD